MSDDPMNICWMFKMRNVIRSINIGRMLTPLCPSNLTLLHCSSFPFPYQFFVFPPNHLEHLLSFFRPLSHLTLRQAMSMYIHHTRAEMASKQTSASVKTWVEVDG